MVAEIFQQISHGSIGYGRDWLAEIVVDQDLDLTKKFGYIFSYRNDQKETFELPFFFSNWNATQGNILFPNFWRNELPSGAAFYTDSAQLALVYCTVDKILNKKFAWIKLIFKPVTIYPWNTLWLYIYICVCVCVCVCVWRRCKNCSERISL